VELRKYGTKNRKDFTNKWQGSPLHSRNYKPQTSIVMSESRSLDTARLIARFAVLIWVVRVLAFAKNFGESKNNIGTNGLA
jgi:hypothetical protein